MRTQRLVSSVVFVSVLYAGTQAPALFHKKINKDQEILHALGRLTFGPRPGDVEQVRKTGLKKWVDRQLHPESIPENPLLQAKLQPLESLRMNPKELTQSYPPPQYIVAVATGKAPMPEDPAQKALVERLALRYKNRIDKKGADAAVLTPARKEPITELLSPAELQTLRKGTPEDRAALLRSMPPERVDKLAFELPDSARRGLFASAPADIRRKILLYSNPQQVLAYDLAEAKLYRAVYSNHQLEEVLTDFWFNHFNVYLDKGADRYLVTAYERDAIRPYVLGNFKDMLLATAQSPAMLFYLDNWQSVAPDMPGRGKAKGKGRGLNENYARELMELHTMGVDGGYTQKDIIEVARCFTGWTIKAPYQGAAFEFNERVHDKGEKVVLGVTIPAGGGKEDGLKVLDILLHHPSTAHFISRSLAVRFISDNPPESVVNQMAKTFQKTNGDLRAVMQSMLNSREFWSQGAYRSKVKSPLEMVASALRATGAGVDLAMPVANKIADLGQPLYRKQEPTGYSNAGAEWMNSGALLARMNFSLALMQNKLQGIKVDTQKFEGDYDAVAKALLFVNASPQTREAIRKGMAEKKEPGVIAGLVLGSPEFQRR